MKNLLFVEFVQSPTSPSDTSGRRIELCSVERGSKSLYIEFQVVLVLYDQSRSAPPGLVIHTLLGDKLIQYSPKMLNSKFPDIFLDEMQNFLTIY